MNERIVSCQREMIPLRDYSKPTFRSTLLGLGGQREREMVAWISFDDDISHSLAAGRYSVHLTTVPACSLSHISTRV